MSRHTQSTLKNPEYRDIRPQQGDRDVELDIVKGFLVIGMILYHVGSFSIASSEIKHLAIGVLLSFVSGSWVFLTGYVVGSHYGAQFATNRRAVILRLLFRGCKILLLFIGINIVIFQLGIAKSTWSLSMEHLFNVLITGGGDLSSFEILAGIGLLLLLSPIFLEIFTRFRALSLAMLMTVALLGSLGISYSPNIWMLICGAFGIWTGLAFKGGAVNWAKDVRKGWMIFAIITISVSSHFWLFYFGASRNDVFIYLLGVISVNAFIYIYFSYYVAKISVLQNALQILGRYSLFSYLWQMAIIWGLIHSVLYLNIQPMYFRDVLVVFFLLLFSVFLLENFRQKLSPVDGLYRLVF